LESKDANQNSHKETGESPRVNATVGQGKRNLTIFNDDDEDYDWHYEQGEKEEELDEDHNPDRHKNKG
jgi:hypothetical protein